jgi:hypothetical protein
LIEGVEVEAFVVPDTFYRTSPDNDIALVVDLLIPDSNNERVGRSLHAIPPFNEVSVGWSGL